MTAPGHPWLQRSVTENKFISIKFILKNADLFVIIYEDIMF